MSKLFIHVPVDGSHRDIEFPGEIKGRLPILGHVPDFLDLVGCQLVVALRPFLEPVEITHGDQPIPADLGRR